MPAPWIDIDLDKPRKLRLQMLQVRNACIESGRPVNELLGDKFAGWPYLLKYGLGWEDKKMSLDGATALMQGWIDAGHDLDDLGIILIDALRNSGLVPKETPAEQDPNGKASEVVPVS